MTSDTIYQHIHALLSNEATDEDRRRVTDWLNSSEANRAEYSRLKRLYHTTRRIPKEEPFDTDAAWQRVSRHTIQKKRTFRLPLWTRYAALLAVVLTVGLLYHTKQPVPTLGQVDISQINEPTLLLGNGQRIALTDESFARQEEHVVIRNDAKNSLTYESAPETQTEEVKQNHLIIPKGKSYHLLLSDGTRICLNSESEISYPTHFGGDRREVTLLGEAFFEVAKDATKPFIVNTNGIKVEVLGTSFNVSCYAADKTVQTTLVTGSVAIHPAKGKPQTLSPSQQLAYNKESGQAEVRVVDTELYTSWTEGRYLFRESTLEEIFNKLNYWYDFTVAYENNDLKNKKYSLVIDRTIALDQLLEIISYTSDVKLERSNQSIHVKQKKENN